MFFTSKSFYRIVPFQQDLIDIFSVNEFDNCSNFWSIFLQVGQISKNRYLAVMSLPSAELPLIPPLEAVDFLRPFVPKLDLMSLAISPQKSAC